MNRDTDGAPLVRLDSFDPLRGARSFRFAGFQRIVRADRVEDVVRVLAEVEAATDAGLHAAGFVAYEAAPAFDPALTTRTPDPRLPLAWFALFSRRDEVAPDEAPRGQFELDAWEAATPEPTYLRRVGEIRELIAAGDTYQVNYTLRLRAAFRGDPVALYDRLARAQRSAFCAYLEVDGSAIISASPELFFSFRGGELEMRPMKGTRPRGRFPAEDAALAKELLASPKERAENLMIVDLLRNDAGRVAEPGSVRVERMFEVERYETVHQLTSTIRARPRAGARLTDIFRALFPCGSVTGAPKVRTMEVIARVEDEPRGVYCGAIGFASPGEAVFSVAIRTVVVDGDAGGAELGVGSGITWDSDAAAEHRECLDKAAFTHRAPNDFQLLETLLYEPGAGFFLLDGHLRRLAGSAGHFGFRFDRREILCALHNSHGTSGTQRVRLLLDRAGEAVVETSSLDHTPSPVRVAIAREPVDSRDSLLFHKTTNRAAYDTRRASRPDCDDVLVVNERGELTESTLANLVLRLDGALWTPPLASGLLPGVFRAHLLERGDIRERVLRPADLERADGIYLINSVRRWRRAEWAG
ncbi:MAG TPA: aminodeoxychorismate synthase component I [Longimicrobium sp.]|nr:aminodeoxychorismate synthase component I [Longimicrobium sp.]